jgi:UPF0271 protein
MKIIDVNCDMGESFGNWRMGCDEEIVKLITTANVACGFHAGDPVTLVRTVDLVKEAGIVAGCHPGLPDLLGFGRRPMQISVEDMYAYVVYQTGAAQATLRSRGLQLRHVKPHGAMFALTSTSAEHARAVVDAIIDTCDAPVLYCPTSIAGDQMPTIAREAGIRVVSEFYPDLHYTDDGFPRTERKKGLVAPEVAAARVREFIQDGTVETVSGRRIPIEAESMCLHGDAPNVVAVANAVVSTLDELGVTRAPAAIATLRGQA